MFKFELPSYEQIKKNTEQYINDCKKFWSDFHDDVQKILKEYYDGKKK
jgi:tRNA uridine 5-carbamoylmethylation protein Kti12